MANEIVRNYLGIICEGGNKAKDDKFARYRTRFGELRKIIQKCSHLCSKPEERDDKVVPPKRHNYKAIPSRRYFRVLHGPELEIHKDKKEKCATEEHWPFLLRFKITFFGICLGVCSQAILWKALASTPSMEFLHVPQIINLVLWSLGLVALTIVFVVYTLKCIFYFEAFRIEYYHPVRGNYIFAPWIACMFLALGVPPLIAKSVNPALWCVFVFPVLCLELKIYGQWMLGGRRRLSEVAHPSNYLTIVGNFVGALLGAETGWKEGALFFFAVGLAHYMVLFVTLYQRLHTAKAVGKELHPLFFLFVATPSVASVAWERIRGEFDYFSRIVYFIALYLYISMVVRLNFFRGFGFSIAWWAYSFPVTGAAVAAIKYSNEVRHPISQYLAVILSGCSSLVVLGLLFTTILKALWGTLFPPDYIIVEITNEADSEEEGHDVV